MSFFYSENQRTLTGRHNHRKDPQVFIAENVQTVSSSPVPSYSQSICKTPSEHINKTPELFI